MVLASALHRLELVEDVYGPTPVRWVLAYTIAAEIGDIGRFATSDELAATPASARA